MTPPTPVIVKNEPVEDDFGDASIVTNDETPENNKFDEPTKENLHPRTPGKRVKIKKVNTPSTPTTPTVDKSAYGSVNTPLGRRSARVAAKMSAKKE